MLNSQQTIALVHFASFKTLAALNTAMSYTALGLRTREVVYIQFLKSAISYSLILIVEPTAESS